MNAASASTHSLWMLALTALLLAACNKGTPPDLYDPAKMDLKPVPAKVHSERHKGAFAEGNSLSMSAELKPLEIRSALESIIGVDRGSVRVSLDTASILFTFDPAHAPRTALLHTANRKLAINRIKLAQLSVMEQSINLATKINPEHKITGTSGRTPTSRKHSVRRLTRGDQL